MMRRYSFLPRRSTASASGPNPREDESSTPSQPSTAERFRSLRRRLTGSGSTSAKQQSRAEERPSTSTGGKSRQSKYTSGPQDGPDGPEPRRQSEYLDSSSRDGPWLVAKVIENEKRKKQEQPGKEKGLFPPDWDDYKATEAASEEQETFERFDRLRAALKKGSVENMGKYLDPAPKTSNEAEAKSIKRVIQSLERAASYQEGTNWEGESSKAQERSEQSKSTEDSKPKKRRNTEFWNEQPPYIHRLPTGETLFFALTLPRGYRSIGLHYFVYNIIEQSGWPVDEEVFFVFLRENGFFGYGSATNVPVYSEWLSEFKKDLESKSMQKSFFKFWGGGPDREILILETYESWFHTFTLRLDENIKQQSRKQKAQEQ